MSYAVPKILDGGIPPESLNPSPSTPIPLLPLPASLNADVDAVDDSGVTTVAGATVDAVDVAGATTAAGACWFMIDVLRRLLYAAVASSGV